MNKSLLLIIILLLIRMISSNAQEDSSILSTPQVKPISHKQINPLCPQLSLEEQKINNLKAHISLWKRNSLTPSPVSPWANSTCADIAQQQELLYNQLKLIKPQYQIKRQIVIAVIDTGIDYTNPSLNSRIYRPAGWNLPEDFKGFNLVQQDFFPMDKVGHGTHVSGIIAGLFPEAKLLPIKFYENSNMRASLGVAIRLAVYMGANIINISGGYGADSTEQEAINLAREKGVLIVSAAGNDSKNLDKIGDEYYPASYESDNIISVMANDDNGYIAPYSNFGINHADISALGTIQSYLPSTISPSCNGSMSGTSQATPIITATVAMLWASQPQLNYNEVKAQVLKGVDTSILFMAANKSQGTVNIDRTISGHIQK